VISIEQSVKNVKEGLKEKTDSSVIHLKSLRKAIGFIALGLPLVLVIGENIRDLFVTRTSEAGRVLIEGSISGYYHTGMREVLVGAICAIAVFLVCYKGYERRDNIAANVAGFSALAIALFPTAEKSREASDTGVRAPDSVTFFSGADAADPAIIGKIHFISATIFFLTLAVMSLFLFTISTKPAMTNEKRNRNKVYIACGVTMVVCIVLIAAGKFFMTREWNEQTSFMFWLESIAVVAFGISWLTKAEVILADSVTT
jgi:hypothetical protein